MTGRIPRGAVETEMTQKGFLLYNKSLFNHVMYHRLLIIKAKLFLVACEDCLLTCVVKQGPDKWTLRPRGDSPATQPRAQIMSLCKHLIVSSIN